MAEDTVTEGIFHEYQCYLDFEQDTREIVSAICDDIERLACELSTLLYDIYDKDEDTPSVCLQARGLFEEAKKGYKRLAEVVPKFEYYRFNNRWRFVTQRYCLLISLTIWLEEGTLAKLDAIAEVLGVMVTNEEGFHLDLEDYLHGVLLLCTDLTRLTVTTVARKQYQRTVQICEFVNEVYSGFRLLNLKNDMLRRRYKMLKRDVRKIDRIVYDLNVQGLLQYTGTSNGHKD